MNRRVGVVIQREFWTTVRRPSYVISTLGMPLFIVLIGGVSMIPAFLVAKKQMRMQTIGIVDHSGVLGLREETTFSIPPPPVADQISRNVASRQGADAFKTAFADASTIRLRPYPSLEEAKDAVRRSEITSAIEFPEDYLATGKVRSYEPQTFIGSSGSARHDLVGRFLVDRLLSASSTPLSSNGCVVR